MVFAGNFIADEAAREDVAARVPQLTAACHILQAELAQAATEIRTVTPAHANKTLRLLQKLADSFSEIGQRRLDLVFR